MSAQLHQIRRLPHYLRAWRTVRNYSQQKLADEAGVTRGLISQLETGCTNYTQETWPSIAKCLCVSPGALIDLPPGPAARIMTRLVTATDEEIAVFEKLLDAFTVKK